MGLLGNGAFELPLTQADLADALGLTTVNVNRVIKRLRDENLVSISNRKLTILDSVHLKNRRRIRTELSPLHPPIRRNRKNCPAFWAGGPLIRMRRVGLKGWAIVRNKSQGRHGGNHNQADELKNRDPKAAAARNTDVESRTGNRNDDTAGGHQHGDR